MNFLRRLLGQNKPCTDLLALIRSKPLPTYVGIIMDGNGRWAKKRGLPRRLGHRSGMEAFKKVVKAAIHADIKYLTVYAFSTENWKRPQEEIDNLMELLVEYINKELSELKSQGVKINILGKIEALPANVQKEIARAVAETSENTTLFLQIALNYGGRMELTEAVRQICRKVASGEIKWENINEELISEHLYTADIPDPDLLIRTSGESRISNFLIWQAAYAEIVITHILWPDFSEEEFYKAVYEYQHRQRRFGGI